MKRSDPRWSELEGGYRERYDPRPALDAAAALHLAGWDALFENLHHQGDVGTASYAAVPEIVSIISRAEAPEWRGYALLASIEECRLSQHNPPVPDWLAQDYRAAWAAILDPALRDFAKTDDPIAATAILAVLAHARGLTAIGAMCLLTEDERQELLEGP